MSPTQNFMSHLTPTSYEDHFADVFSKAVSLLRTEWNLIQQKQNFSSDNNNNNDRLTAFDPGQPG